MAIVRYRDGNGNIMPLRVIRGEDGNQMFVRYSVYPDGTDMSETWDDTMSFMGIALAPVNAVPTDKSDYQWIRASSLKIFEGSYTGDGVVPSSENPVTLNLPFEPKLLTINGGETVGYLGIWVRGSRYLRVLRTSSSNSHLPGSNVESTYCIVSSETKKFAWWTLNSAGTGVTYGLNSTDYTYHYVAIG